MVGQAELLSGALSLAALLLYARAAQPRRAPTHLKQVEKGHTNSFRGPVWMRRAAQARSCAFPWKHVEKGHTTACRGATRL